MKSPVTRSGRGVEPYRTAYDNAVARAARLAVARRVRRICADIRKEREIVIGRWDALARERDERGDSAGKRYMREAKIRIVQGLDAALACVRVERKRKL